VDRANENRNEIILGECPRDKEEGVKLVLYTKNLTLHNGKSTAKKEEADVESVRV